MEASIMPYQAGLDRRICPAMGGAMSVAAATTVIRKPQATTTASNADRRRRVRVRLTDVGHYPMVEAPARFVAAVLPFLS